MWSGRWGSSAVNGYIEDARTRSRAGAEVWFSAFAAGASSGGEPAPGNSLAREFVEAQLVDARAVTNASTEGR